MKNHIGTFFYSLILCFASSASQASQKEGAFGVKFNTDVAVVIGRLDGRYGPLSEIYRKIRAKDDGEALRSRTGYVITPPNPSKYLEGYRVGLYQDTLKVYYICATANKDSIDRNRETYQSISERGALLLFDTYDKALTKKYGKGVEVYVQPIIADKRKHFPLSMTQYVEISYDAEYAMSLEPTGFEFEICYYDRVIPGGMAEYSKLPFPDVIEIDESSL